MIMIEYSKIYSITGKNKLIVRFLSEEIRDLLIKYLSLIHSMEIFILKQIENETFDNYEKILFTDEERAWDRQ